MRFTLPLGCNAAGNDVFESLLLASIRCEAVNRQINNKIIVASNFIVFVKMLKIILKND